MTRDLSIPVEIIGVPTTREVSGLAMSSRNGYLTAEQKDTAAILFKVLNSTAKQLTSGNRNYGELEGNAKQQLQQSGLNPDYFSIAQRDTLKAATLDDDNLIILAAAFLGPVRLIDNLQVDIK